MKGFMLIFCSLLIAFGATAQSKLGSQTPKKSIFITSILLVLMTLVSCSVGYKNDGKEVTWHTWNEGSGHTSRHVDADPKTFEKLDDDYGRDKKHAFYEGDIINGADGGSFRVLTKSYAADNTHVYVSGELIEKAGRYFNSNYQYYAKTDKPFKTTGRYGYSHGGFTPQECIIPAYELNIETNNMALGVMISNKKELKSVTGNYFTVKLLAEGCESDLFRNERKVKLLLYAGNKMVSGNQIYSMKPSETIHAEFEMTLGIDKVVLVDKETSVQIDSCSIIKSASRDLDDLL